MDEVGGGREDEVGGGRVDEVGGGRGVERDAPEREVAGSRSCCVKDGEMLSMSSGGIGVHDGGSGMLGYSVGGRR